jgi:hypothetical protein
MRGVTSPHDVFFSLAAQRKELACGGETPRSVDSAQGWTPVRSFDRPFGNHSIYPTTAPTQLYFVGIPQPQNATSSLTTTGSDSRLTEALGREIGSTGNVML